MEAEYLPFSFVRVTTSFVIAKLNSIHLGAVVSERISTFSNRDFISALRFMQFSIGWLGFHLLPIELEVDKLLCHEAGK